jgi:hypothetical protein
MERNSGEHLRKGPRRLVASGRCVNHQSGGKDAFICKDTEERSRKPGLCHDIRRLAAYRGCKGRNNPVPQEQLRSVIVEELLIYTEI